MIQLPQIESIFSWEAIMKVYFKIRKLTLDENKFGMEKLNFCVENSERLCSHSLFEKEAKY